MRPDGQAATAPRRCRTCRMTTMPRPC